MWTAFLAAKADVNREADAILIACYTCRGLPHSEDFRQDLKAYVRAVMEEEWTDMGQGFMSPEASRRYDRILAKFADLNGDSDKISAIL